MIMLMVMLSMMLRLLSRSIEFIFWIVMMLKKWLMSFGL